jgi:hypothetical protein
VTKIRSPDEPLAKIAKLAKEKRRERGDGDTDHVAEITQLKERIASMQKTITAKNSELVSKQVIFSFDFLIYFHRICLI